MSRRLSRTPRGLARRAKARAKRARPHARIANIRQDALHRFTTDLARRFCPRVIEDLNLRGRMANRHGPAPLPTWALFLRNLSLQ
ncbi:transposase [Thermochromatium tepidum]|uniref:transposase n=1 Tax=Thermochromatium tepidum TaxID=1050 RepID=UPI003CCCF0C4